MNERTNERINECAIIQSKDFKTSKKNTKKPTGYNLRPMAYSFTLPFKDPVTLFLGPFMELC